MDSNSAGFILRIPASYDQGAIVLTSLRWMIATGLAVLTTVLGSSPLSAMEPTVEAEHLEFFENSVRPLLVTACGECHGAKTQWGSLRVDSRQTLVDGGDSGPAIVPGAPDESLLIQAVRRTGIYEMPPDEPLTPEQVAILERWVALGAPWPTTEIPPADNLAEQQRSHWAFQPLSAAVPPAMDDDQWCQTPIDAFILAKLHANELVPSPAADRRTLIRRVAYSLTGLPPTAEDVQRFIADPDPLAYEKLVDHYLASPHYGEHWGRKWLDLARYADTKGYMYAWEIPRFVHSTHYRDWVVQALNDDVPYDRFLLLQIAADQVADASPNDLAAMGFLTLGRRFLGNEHDIIDDRIDVLSRTTMGLTVSCARCHDHKYDPIPTADYYSLYGVFQNSHELLVRAGEQEADPALEEELASLQKKLANVITEQRGVIAERMRSRIRDYFVAQLDLSQHPDIPFSQILEPEDLFPVYVHRLDAYLRKMQRDGSPIFLAWHRFAELPPEAFTTDVATTVTQELHELGHEQLLPLVAAKFQIPPSSMQDVAERYGDLFLEVDRQWRATQEQAIEQKSQVPERLADADLEALRQVLYGADSPCSVPDEELASISTYFAVRTELPSAWEQQVAVEKLLLDRAPTVPFAVILADRAQIQTPRIFHRGNPANKRDEVPMRFPTVVSGADSAPFAHGSGRRELAAGIIEPTNPLTARVWVNRLWQHHFGTGIVPTPSDFGTRASSPAHLELLDWLALRLIQEGWSTKAIHRLILLSATYQQQSMLPQGQELLQHARRIDPENHLLWKMNSQRLTFEELRDSLLLASGELDHAVGGREPALFTDSSDSHRRTLYGLIDRQRLSDAYRAFDFANPDLHIPSRSETTVPQQALFALNHPFVAARAETLAVLSEAETTSTSDRIEYLYQRVYQRSPTAGQLRAAEEFLATTDDAEVPDQTAEQIAWQYGYGSIDSSAGQVTAFTPLPYFNGTAWQGSEQWPDAALGWAQLTADGGHPGNDDAHAVVRRWTAPRSMTISLRSTVEHAEAAGNGIRCWVISNRHGLISMAALHNGKLTVERPALSVEAGDVLDFVVDIHGNLNTDQYLWHVAISELLPPEMASETVAGSWDSTRDFSGPPDPLLGPWAQLAQVLLLSNEFMFVD